jgi:excisionase family DNA binding protein
MDGDFVTVEDAALRAGVSRQRVRLLCKQGRLPGARRFGRDWLVPVQGLAYWLDRDRDRRRKAKTEGDMT